MITNIGMVETTVHKALSGQTRLKRRGQRCSLSPKFRERLGVDVDQHIRVEYDGVAAFYVVDQFHEDDEYPLRTAKKGRKRIGVRPGNRITVSTLVPQGGYLEARMNGGFTETVCDDGNQDSILFVAPHGGDIEFGTDDVAVRSYKAMHNNGLPASVWMCHGFNNSLTKDSFRKWHIKKPCRSIQSYPGLQSVSDRRYDHVVSFHVQSKDKERDEYYIGVGGRVDDEIRFEVADRLWERTGKTVKEDLEEMKWSGTHEDNCVNYLSKNGGLQLELTPGTAYRYRRRVAQVVYTVFSDLI